jgi:hypothetical protein
MNDLFSFIALVSFHGIFGTPLVPILPGSLTYVLTQTLTYVLKLSITDVLKLDRTGNREQGTGIVVTVRSDEFIGEESTATALPVFPAAVLRIPFYQRTLRSNR